MVKLTEKKCMNIEKACLILEEDAILTLKKELKDDWDVVNEHHLEKEFTFKNFKEALAFTNKVGELAENENHHPDIYLGWGKVRIVLWTHKINGLSDNDFIMAAKIDTLN